MPSFGVRKVSCKDPAMLRLFFLSLLWGAAATNRPEFREIHVDKDHLDRLRRMVHDGDPVPLDFYPTRCGLFSATRNYQRQLMRCRIKFQSFSL